ncbi:MAG: DUF302 domain-containing protein [Acidimicrobiia bacterium]|nr:DUF302 domain-containing protein [Acidimicrobiia bacterium]
MIFEESVVVAQPFDQVVDAVIAALAEQGFGVLTEIDLEDTLRRKVGAEIGRYRILGACNPTLASKAVEAVPQIGVLLPCNVTVRETDNGVVVEAMDPGLMASIAGAEALRPVADQARELIGNALNQVMASTS